MLDNVDSIHGKFEWPTKGFFLIKLPFKYEVVITTNQQRDPSLPKKRIRLY